jgi:nucleotide-binding universal stress UspA family protein
MKPVQRGDERARTDDRQSTVVVYTDGSYEASEVVGWAGRLAQTRSVPLVVSRTWSPLLGEVRAEARAAAQRRLLRELRTWSQPALDIGVEPRLVITEGDSAVAVLAHASTERAGLLVLPSTEKHLAERLVAASMLPVAIVPVAGASRPMARVLVALNGSLASQAACSWTAELASHTGSHVDAVTVFEPLVEWVPNNDPRSVTWKLRDDLGGPWTATLGAAGVPTTTEVIDGLDPIGGLVRFAHQHRDDVLVVGHDRRSHHLWRGVFGIRLLKDANLPVVLVPEAA